MPKKPFLLKFLKAARLRADELPTEFFLEPDTLYLLPLPDRVKACCEDKDEDVMEIEYRILTESDGKQRFGHLWCWPESRSRKWRLVYDRITKLTYGHYLCANGSRYTFYAIYRDELGREELQPTIRFTFQGELTLDHFLQSLSETYPSIYNELSTYLYKIPDQEGYISVYRQYIRWLIGSDIFLPLAFQRVVLDSHFNITPYDVVD
jgi:hypothetical protein